jgi:hypothetical protein
MERAGPGRQDRELGKDAAADKQDWVDRDIAVEEHHT